MDQVRDHKPRAVRYYTPEEEMAMAAARHEGRRDRLRWCKDRALAEIGHLHQLNSFVSDASKDWQDANGDVHPFLFDWHAPVYHALLQMGMSHAIRGDDQALRAWVEGFA